MHNSFNIKVRYSNDYKITNGSMQGLALHEQSQMCCIKPIISLFVLSIIQPFEEILLQKR